MRQMTTICGRESWILIFPDLLHGQISSQDIANGTLTLETDGGRFITRKADAFAFTRVEVLAQIAAAVTRLGVLAAQFDEEYTRDHAPIIAPSLRQNSEKVGTIEI